jgi:DedD protein
MSETQEAQQLRRRARRRLVGAIALVLFLVIVPPMVMDLEPKPVATDLKVEIPRPESARLATPPPPQTRPAPAEKAAPAAPAERRAEEQKAAAEDKKPAPAPKIAAAAPRKSQESERVEAILKGEVAAEPKRDVKTGDAKAAAKSAGESFVVPLGAYANPDNVKQLQAKLARAGVKSFTEPVKAGPGGQIRVSAGPYASRAEAEMAREKLAGLKDLGVVPGTVTTR